MSFVYSKPNKSGIGDRMIDIILVTSYSEYLGCNKCFVEWSIDSPLNWHVNVYNNLRKEKTPFRSVDYKLENLLHYLEIPKNIIFTNNRKPKLTSVKPLYFAPMLGARYNLYSFMDYFKISNKEKFIKIYYETFKKIKFKNIPKEMVEYFKNNKVLTVHLRRGDKVIPSNLWSNDADDISSSMINELDNLTKRVINNIGNTELYIVSDELSVRTEYINYFKDKYNCKFFKGDEISQTYFDLYCLAHSNHIVMSQAFSNFSIFASLINNVKFNYLLDHPKMKTFDSYMNISKYKFN